MAINFPSSPSVNDTFAEADKTWTYTGTIWKLNPPVTILTGNATTNQVFNGQTFYSNDANTQLTGTFIFNGNAAVADVSTGQTFYATNGTQLTGTGTILSLGSTNESVIALTQIGESNTTITGFSLFVNNGAIFHTTSLQGIVRKFDLENLTFLSQSNNLDSFFHTVKVNNGFVYAGGGTANRAVYKFHESNLVYVANTVAYTTGGQIYGIETDSQYIYVGGQTTNAVRRYHIGNMAFVNQSAGTGAHILGLAKINSNLFTLDLGGWLRKWSMSNLQQLANVRARTDGFLFSAVGVDDLFVYVSGNSNVVSKYHASNLVLVGNTSSYGVGAPETINVANGFIYVGGTNTVADIKKFSASNLAFVGSSLLNYGASIRSIVTHNDTLYVVGTDTSPNKSIKKFSQRGIQTIINGISYYLVGK